MKQLTTFILLCGITSTVVAQKVNQATLPNQVRQSFEKEYPGTKASWEKENGGYEASFRYKGKDMSVVLSENGTIIETETIIKKSELPATAISYITKRYKEKIKEAARIVDSKGTITYEAEIKGKDLLFDSKGTFIKEVKHGKED